MPLALAANHKSGFSLIYFDRLERPEIPLVRPFESMSSSGQAMLQLFSEHERQKTAKNMAGDVGSKKFLLPEKRGVNE